MGKGLDEQQEKDLIYFRPDLSRDIDKARELPDRDPVKEQEVKDSVVEAIAAYVDGMQEVDDLLNTIDGMVEQQQQGLDIPIDPLDEPIVAEDVAFLNNGTELNAIDYKTWRKARGIVKKTAMRKLGGHPLAINSISEARRIEQNIQRVDDISMITMAWNAIKAHVYRAVAKMAPPPLKGRLKRAADKAEKGSFGLSDLGFSEYEAIEGNADDDTSDNFVTDESKTGPIKYPARGYITEPGKDPQPPNFVNEAPRSDRVVNRVMQWAIEEPACNLVEAINRGAFIYEPMVEQLRMIHETNKAAFDAMGWTVPEGTSPTIREWAGKEWSDLKQLGTNLPKIPTEFEKKMAAEGHEGMLRVLRNIENDLRTWTRGLHVKCCLIRSLVLFGKVDPKYLHTMRLLVKWRLGQVNELINIHANAGITFINQILSALASKYITPLQTVYWRWIKSWLLTLKSEIPPGYQDCTPLDEFIDLIINFGEDISDELLVLIDGYVNQMKLDILSLDETRGSAAEKSRLECLYRLLDILLVSLETRELCNTIDIDEFQDNPDKIIQELDKGLPGGLGGIIAGAGGREVILVDDGRVGDVLARAIDRNELDKLRGEEDLPEEVLTFLNDCQQGPSIESLKKMNIKLSKILGEQ